MARKKENLKPKDLEKEEGPYQLVLVGKGTPRVVTSDWCDKNESSIEAYIGQFEDWEFANLACKHYIEKPSTARSKKINEKVSKLKSGYGEINSLLLRAEEGVEENVGSTPALPMTPVMAKSQYNNLVDALTSKVNKTELKSRIRASFNGDANPTIRKIYNCLFGPKVMEMIFAKQIIIQISPIYEVIKEIGTEIFGDDEALFVSREKEYFIRNKKK